MAIGGSGTEEAASNTSSFRVDDYLFIYLEKGSRNEMAMTITFQLVGVRYTSENVKTVGPGPTNIRPDRHIFCPLFFIDFMPDR